MSSVISKVDQMKEYGVVPPNTLRSAEPPLPPKQLAFVPVIPVLNTTGSLIVTVSSLIQLLLSVTVT